MPFWDNTFLLLIPAFILALWAQARVKSAYAKWSKVKNHQGLTGAEVAKIILDNNQLSNIPIKQIPGELTDNYNPIKKELNLSIGVYNNDTVAAIGIAAHETGHAIQHSHSYAPLQFRNSIFPVANFGSVLAFPLFFIGLIFGYNKTLMDLGILLFSGFVLFTLITLPVEFNASKRAIAILQHSGYFTSQEMVGVKDVLNAAALTYVASAATAILELLRLLIIRGERD